VLLLLSPQEHVLYERYAQAKATSGRALLSLERMKDHLARFEWPSEDERATDVSSVEALGAYLGLIQRTTVQREA
jgi:hypothetical protein